MDQDEDDKMISVYAYTWAFIIGASVALGLMFVVDWVRDRRSGPPEGGWDDAKDIEP